MVEANNTTVTLQVHRFTPRPERAERAAARSPRKAPRSVAARIQRHAAARVASSGCRNTPFPRVHRTPCSTVC